VGRRGSLAVLGVELEAHRVRHLQVVGLHKRGSDRDLPSEPPLYLSGYIANNPLQPELTNSLSIELTNNQAFYGYNISLCTFNFVWAFFMFCLACLSFYITSKESSEVKKVLPETDKLERQPLPEFFSSVVVCN
jgi:hypothetical protein